MSVYKRAMQNIKNALYEDTLQCQIYNKSNCSSKLEETCSEINSFLKTLTDGYIWHRDDFKLCQPIEPQTDLPDHLIGITYFGDNIDDEWFIVYLLLETSKQFKDLLIQATDFDGDFLLIEAAEYLPVWVNPQCTENRVFIHDGSIHIIPPSLIDVDSGLSIKYAIELISNNLDSTRAAPEIQQAISKRIGNHPNKFKDNLHHAIVNLPLDIAALLTVKPSIISALVTTYCNHDPIDIKNCRDMTFENTGPVKVKFTKCLYAMLMHSKLIKSRISHANDKRTSLGLKLTSGYHMIVKQYSGQVYESKQFKRFLDSLTSNGYFKDNIKGSKDYTELLNIAKEYFRNIECPTSVSVYNIVTETLSSTEFSKVKESIQKKQNTIELTEDSDYWLNIDPKELNDILESKYGTQMKKKLQPETMSSQLTNFLQQTSDFEGIEPAERDESKDENILEFDSDEFINSLQKMLNMVSDNNESNVDSDMYSDSDDEDNNINAVEFEMDYELKGKLEKYDDLNNKNIVQNFAQSVKEEGGAPGPTSNLLKSIGINKEHILDSDDDEYM